MAEYDISDVVLLEFDPGGYYPYFVYNGVLINAPVVLPLVERDVFIADLALNTTVEMPAGVYIAIPKKAFRPALPPERTEGRAVYLEVLCSLWSRLQPPQ